MISHFEDHNIIDGLIFEIISKDLFNKIYQEFRNDPNTQEHVTYPLRIRNYKCKKTFLDKSKQDFIYQDNGIKICVDEVDDLKRLRKAWSTKNFRNIIIANTKEIISRII